MYRVCVIHITELSKLPPGRCPHPIPHLANCETEQKTANDKTVYKYLADGQIDQLVDHSSHATEKKENNKLGVNEKLTHTFCMDPPSWPMTLSP